jgi:hypothetical protein
MHIVLAAYRLDDAIAALSFFARHFPKRLFKRRLLVVNDSRLIEKLATCADGWELIEGTNSLGEFSAWQEGLDTLLLQEETVVFANDTISTHRHFTWLRAAAFRSALNTARGKQLVGFTDSVPGSVVVAGLPVSHWVSTYCFALTGPALQALDHRVSRPDLVKMCVQGGVDEEKFFTNISPDLEAHLRRWLFCGWWYAGGRLTSENSSRLKRKAEAIISEKLLSATCHALSITIENPFWNRPVIKVADGVYRRLAAAFPRSKNG